MKPEMRIALFKEAAHAKDASTGGMATLAKVIRSIAEKNGSLFLYMAFLSASFVFIGWP
jgi:hypothetical protein